MSRRFQAGNGGRFISRGRGRHPERVIDSYELIVVASGVLGIFEEERRYEVKSGEYLLLRPGKRHGGTLDYPPELSFFWLHFHAAAPPALPPSGPLANPEKTGDLFRLCLQYQDEPGAPPAAGDLLLQLLLLECARPPSGERPAALPAVRACELIRRRCVEPDCSPGRLAAELHCHRDYLNRLYRRAYGVTLGEAINLARLDCARRLLLRSTQSIKEIAFAAGFSDPAYFRRRFFRRFAQTPSACRRQQQRGHRNYD